MRIQNVHSRDLPASAERAWELVAGLASERDELWPHERWPTTPVEFDRPLGPGAKGGHGLIRYGVDSYVPGQAVVFRFAPGSGLDGIHRFEVEPIDELRSRLTHTLDADVGWTLRPFSRVLLAAHDALMEDLLDNAERAAGGSPASPPPLPRAVRLSNAVEAGVLALLRIPLGSGEVKPLPKSSHTSRPWRIHEVAPDFRVEDVWALPTPGGPNDLPRLVRQATTDDPRALNAKGKYVGVGSHGIASRVSRALFELRWKLGESLGWDDRASGVGRRVATLRDRLPVDLRDGPRGPDLRAAPMTSLYLTDNEWATEMANRTVHSVMHIGWVEDEAGGYRGQMAVLVKPNGRFGAAYMAAIKPFRYLIVYPALMRSIERDWRTNADDRAPHTSLRAA